MWHQHPQHVHVCRASVTDFCHRLIQAYCLILYSYRLRSAPCHRASLVYPRIVSHDAGFMFSMRAAALQGLPSEWSRWRATFTPVPLMLYMTGERRFLSVSRGFSLHHTHPFPMPSRIHMLSLVPP